MVEISIGRFKLYTEVPVLLLFYAFMVGEPVNTNFIMYRTCYVSLGYNETDCAALGSGKSDNATKELEQIVQPYANVILMSSSLVNQILPSFFCLFVGPWSDKHGRKPIMISSFLGFTVGSVISIVVSMVHQASPWYTLLSSIPVVLGGGFASLLMAILCNITDVTTEKNRGLRIGALEGVIALGMVLGTFSSSYVFNATGYTGVFGLSTACLFVAWLYVIFLTPETITGGTSEDDSKIFSFTNIADMFKTTFRKRENYTRAVLLILVSISIVYVVASTSDTSVLFLYLRERFDWDLKKYSMYKSARDLCYIGGTFVGICLMHKLCRIPETAMMLIGFVAYFIGVTFQGLATEDWHIYLAGGIRCISGVISPMCRSLISKLVSTTETGKVFSLTVSLECLMMMVGTPVYTMIYNNTISTAPNFFNFVTAGLFAVEILLVVAVIVIRRVCRSSYVLLDASDVDAQIN